MIPLTSRQSELYARARLRVVTLARLITYTDRSAGTVDQVFAFSEGGVIYPWSGTPTEFEPFLSGPEPLRSAINHLPDPGDGGGDSLRRRVRLSLINGNDADGVPLYTRLRQHTLEFASVELAELPVDLTVAKDRRFDLRHLVGDEHLMRFRGRVRRIEVNAANEIILSAVSDIPDMPVYPLFTSEVDPRHYGQRVGFVFGESVRAVPGLNARLPIADEYGVLAASIGAADTTITVLVDQDNSSLWGSTGTARIENEQMSYGATSYDIDTETLTLLTVTRGTGGTTAAAHDSGELVSRVASPEVQLAAIFAKSPAYLLPDPDRHAQDIAVRDQDSFYPKATSAPTVVPDLQTFNAEDLGYTAIGVTMNLDQLSSLVASLGRRARVTQQAVYSLTPGVVLDDAVVQPTGTETTAEQKAASNGDWNTSLLQWQADETVGTPREQIVIPYQPGDFLSNPGPTDVITRMRIYMKDIAWTVQKDRNIEFVSITCKARNFEALNNATLTAKYDDFIDDGSNAGGVANGTMSKVGEWITPDDPNLTFADLDALGPKLKFWCNYEKRSTGNDPDPLVELTGTWGVQFEWIPSGSSADIAPRLQDAAIFARGDTVDYLLFANVTGSASPGPPYEAALDATITHPVDIYRYLITEALSQPASSIDATSWAWAVTQLAGIRPKVVTMEMGDTFERVSAGIGFNTRSQLITVERSDGMKWVLLCADPSGAYPAAVGSVTEFEDFAEEGRDADSIYTAFFAFYKPDRALRFSDTGWQAAFRGEAGNSDFTVDPVNFSALNASYGRWAHPGMSFIALTNQGDMEDVFGFYVRELSRAALVYALSKVPWSEAAALELGDVVNVTPPWETSARKCRVIEIVRRWDDGLADLRVVEVL